MRLNLTLLCFSLMLLLSCRSTGRVEAIAYKSNRIAGVTLGYLETRDLRYDARPSADIGDMLTYELERLGYTVTPANFETLDRRSQPASNGKTEPNDLMPEAMRGLAGETAPRIRSNIGQRHLNADEIRQMYTTSSFNYFVQGAISRSESGNLLEPESGYTILLSVFGPDGKKTGAVSFTVQNNDLADSSLLRSVCSRMAHAFDSQIHKGLPSERPRLDAIREMFGIL